MTDLNLNFAECFHSMNGFTQKVVTNICTGDVVTVPYQGLEYLVVGMLVFVVIGLLVLVTAMVATW